jgi:hypothetical protein
MEEEDWMLTSLIPWYYSLLLLLLLMLLLSPASCLSFSD